MIVLDNACGSGNTGRACLNINRKFILIDKDEKTWKKTNNELKEQLNDKNKHV
jgi:DNA modification methylase